jgi:small subunit ribosomal protein S29
VKDQRVEAAMKDVSVINLKGLSKDEARGVMEYYARSGLFRESVTDSMVSEKWTLAGSGIIGELEKASVGARF